MKKLAPYLILSLIAFPAGLWASAGTEGAAFLDIPVGAGPAAMGSAYNSLAADAYAPIYNPAGLALLPNTQVAAQHLAYLESIHYQYLSGVHPLGNGKALGVSAQYLGTGDIAGTDPSGAPIGDYSDSYGAYSAAYGQKLNDRLSLGVTGKWVHAKLADVSANAYAMDLGGLYQVDRRLRLALTVQNLGSSLRFSDQSDPLPRAFHAGASFEPNRKWVLSGEGVYAFNGVASGRLGVAWSPLDLIVLRGGYRTDSLKELSALAGLSLGMGVHIWGHELAYAWLPYGELGNSQYISLVMSFGRAEEQGRNLIQYEPIRGSKSRSVQTSPQDPSESDYQQMMELLIEDKERVVEVQTPEKGKQR